MVEVAYPNKIPILLVRHSPSDNPMIIRILRQKSTIHHGIGEHLKIQGSL